MKSPQKLLVALAAGAALLIAGCGDSFSHNSSHSASASAGRSVDRAFIAQMIAHHRSAIQMGRIAQRRGQSAFVKQLADDIVRTQTQEISTMRAIDRRLRRAGLNKGSLGVPDHMMGMHGDLSTLRRAKAFDPAFLRMMISHHQGAVVMAKAELAKGQDRELKTLAQNIITVQQREIRAMRKHLGASGTGMHEAPSTHGDTAAPTPPRRSSRPRPNGTRAPAESARR